MMIMCFWLQFHAVRHFLVVCFLCFGACRCRQWSQRNFTTSRRLAETPINSVNCSFLSDGSSIKLKTNYMNPAFMAQTGTTTKLPSYLAALILLSFASGLAPSRLPPPVSTESGSRADEKRQLYNGYFTSSVAIISGAAPRWLESNGFPRASSLTG